VVEHTDLWEYRADLEKLARYLCRHSEDAEDVAHDALLKASEKLDGFRGEASVRTWLHTIATNECRMLRRRKAPSSLDQMFDEAALGELEIIGSPPHPEEVAMEIETRHEVLEAISGLPDRYRCALLLKDGQDLSVQEVAEAMGTTVSSVRSVLYRARQVLRERLGAPAG
jgi:RNA polymerase sigma-70 factor (ECF subfamily)